MIDAQFVVDNADDFADERDMGVAWIIENAEDIADEENAREMP